DSIFTSNPTQISSSNGVGGATFHGQALPKEAIQSPNHQVRSYPASTHLYPKLPHPAPLRHTESAKTSHYDPLFASRGHFFR
ncbi:hypothetical protein ACU605_24685, partial [Klebsiella aerogenes]